MSTVYVWVLVVYVATSGYNTSSGGPMLIDNISTKEECERVQKILDSRDRVQYTHCIEVQKKVVTK